MKRKIDVKRSIRRSRKKFYWAARKEVKLYLQEQNITVLHPFEIVEACEKILGITPADPSKGNKNVDQRFNFIYPKIIGKNVPNCVTDTVDSFLDDHPEIKIISKKKPTDSKIEGKIDFSKDANDRVKKFYASYEWHKLRYTTLKKYNAKCMICRTVDRVIHVDHIKPLRKHWSLRLDPNNVQVLCESCNYGKGNWDETDWRPRKTIRIMPI